MKSPHKSEKVNKNVKENIERLPLQMYLRINLKRFLLETALNGLKYVADSERSIWERLYYLISFLICFICGLYMAIYFLNKWQNTPVIISLSSQPTPIENLPFPSVTICNMNSLKRSKVENIEVDSPEYAYRQKICSQKYDYTRFQNFTPRSEKDTMTYFHIDNAQSCAEMIVYCKFGDVEENCTDLFREVQLDEGLCCIFNQLHPFFLVKGNQMISGRNFKVNRNERKNIEKLPIHTYVRINLKRFLLETALNGLKYVADSERSIWERMPNHVKK
ncbi:pickpocket protein 28-like [Musca vetustissima]|uniref:pickpocket protein 28-like n=1 Tax=Musca vetustissima TaxID=27455 RepID=UPI002AB61368|nr:pickpocket protein 28-like [Musca vetustissima]